MKKTLILLTLFLSLNSLSASLKMTKEKTNSLEKDAKYIKYKKEKHEKMDESSYIQFSDLGYGVQDLKAITGLSNINVYASNKPTKEIDDAHTSKMIKSFKNAVGEDWFFRNKDRYYIMSSFTNPRWWSGIIVNSKFGVYGGRSYLSGDGIYFGNVINETLLNNYMPRLATANTDDRNLLIIAFPNAEEKKNNSDAEVLLNDATAKFPLYSDEIAKLFRSQRIMVDAANCFNYGKKDVTNFVLLNESYRGKKISDFSNKCTMSQKNDEVGADALYARGNTIVALGNIYSKVNDSSEFGTSFATPRTAGYAAIILNKFKGLTYHQVKEILLTTAYREKDRLDNQMGWGIVDIRKALNGPTNLNAGLIEENKFYTGMYDKIFNKKSNDIYFWAEPETDWVWTNDIDSGLSDKPSGTSTYIMALDKDDNSITGKVTIQNYLSSEENFYKETSKYVPGLRKAGKHKLTITGDLLYGGETQVLEGTLKLTGNIPDSTIVVYEGATLELCGNANKVVLAGGKIEACSSAKYTLVNEDREDIEVNKKKVIDIPKLFYFTQSNKIETNNFKDYDKYNKFLNKHYHHIKSNYNFGKMPKDEFYAGKNQVYAHDYSYKLTGKWDFTDTYEFYKYMNEK